MVMALLFLSSKTLHITAFGITSEVDGLKAVEAVGCAAQAAVVSAEDLSAIRSIIEQLSDEAERRLLINLREINETELRHWFLTPCGVIIKEFLPRGKRVDF